MRTIDHEVYPYDKNPKCFMVLTITKLSDMQNTSTFALKFRSLRPPHLTRSWPVLDDYVKEELINILNFYLITILLQSFPFKNIVKLEEAMDYPIPVCLINATMSFETNL